MSNAHDDAECTSHDDEDEDDSDDNNDEAMSNAQQMCIWRATTARSIYS
jgi:hypothetical protein